MKCVAYFTGPPTTDTLYEQIKNVTLKLLAYCQANDWAGYDPYDSLNSQVLKYLPFLDFRLFRLGLTQMLRKSPLNFRPVLGVPKTQNPKAIALFLMAFLKLKESGLLENEDLITLMTQKLINLRSPDHSYWCWGYSFPWQTRRIVVARGAPNLVCTSFVANALLDAYEERHEVQYLRIAVNAAEYILNELYWTEGDSTACFSYFRYPLRSLPHRVHNVNFLGAALLCRVYKYCGEERFLRPALKVARYSAAKQHHNGSWDYGEDPTHRWIDNFHTGYSLCALRSICQDAETSEFEVHVRLGLEFYRRHFFKEDGAPKYYYNRTYPIDIHNVAQSIITLLAFKDLDEDNLRLLHSVFRWAMAHLWDDQGYFYYQALPFSISKISYMRWSQAWMLLALSALLGQYDESTDMSFREANRLQ